MACPKSRAGRRTISCPECDDGRVALRPCLARRLDLQQVMDAGRPKPPPDFFVPPPPGFLARPVGLLAQDIGGKLHASDPQWHSGTPKVQPGLRRELAHADLTA